MAMVNTYSDEPQPRSPASTAEKSPAVGGLSSDEVLAALKALHVRSVDVALALGIKARAVADLLRGARPLRPEEVARLVEAFGLTPDSLAEPIRSGGKQLYCSSMETKEILGALRARGVRWAEIATVLGLHRAAATRLSRGSRRLRAAEAERLRKHFGLSQADPPPPAPEQGEPHPLEPLIDACAAGSNSTLDRNVAELLVLVVAARLDRKVDPTDPIVPAVATELQAIADYLSRPEVAAQVEEPKRMFQALELARAIERQIITAAPEDVSR